MHVRIEESRGKRAHMPRIVSACTSSTKCRHWTLALHLNPLSGLMSLGNGIDFEASGIEKYDTEVSKVISHHFSKCLRMLFHRLDFSLQKKSPDSHGKLNRSYSWSPAALWVRGCVHRTSSPTGLKALTCFSNALIRVSSRKCRLRFSLHTASVSLCLPEHIKALIPSQTPTLSNVGSGDLVL